MATAVDELLDMLFDMVDEAKNAAFSGDKCVIERDKALDLIEDAKKQLPVDLAEARKTLNARNEYLAAAKREADAKARSSAAASGGIVITGEGDPAIDALVLQRAEAKKAKNFAEADRIRDELKAQGIEVTDTKDGAAWRRV